MTTDPTPETAGALLWRHGLPEDVIDGALALFAQELAGKIRAWHDHLPGEHQCCDGNAADLISPENWARTLPAAVPPTGPDAEIRRARYAAVIRKAGDTAYGNGPFVEAIADAVIAVAETEQAGLRRERDLAIAHDRQPYPTAWAYEQACKALRRKEAVIERVAQMADAWESQLPEVIRTPAVVSAIRAALEAAEAPAPETHQPVKPTSHTWTFEVCYDGDKWHGCGPTYDDSVFGNAHETAQEDFLHRAENDKQRRRFRMIRATTTHVVEAEHQAAAVAAGVQTNEEADNPRTVCVCSHTRGEHVTVSGRLLCDSCDPDSNDNLVCKGFEAL